MSQLSERQCRLLRDSFESIKHQATDIGLSAMKQILEKAPQISERFQDGPNSSVRKGDGWELSSQGVIILSGIERCLLRLNNTKSFEVYIKKLVERHVVDYHVPADEILFGLDVFKSTIFDHLDRIHRHRNSSSSSSIDSHGPLQFPDRGLSHRASIAASSLTASLNMAAAHPSGARSKRRHSVSISDMAPILETNCQFHLGAPTDDFPRTSGQTCEICIAWRQFFRIVSDAVTRCSQEIF